MEYFEIVILAIALSMDCFAVSISIIVSHPKLLIKKQWQIATIFGLFHAIMPILGYFSGNLLHKSISQFDFWIASGILFLIGGKMIYEAITRKKESITEISWKKLLILAVATSLDVFAAGLTFSLLECNIAISILIIGTIVTAISITALKLGQLIAKKLSSKTSTIIGGIILIVIGIKIIVTNI